jgi:hypothetical protein
MKLITALAVLAGTLLLPAAAQAHHVDQGKSSADCYGARVALEDFSVSDGAVSWTAKIDGSSVASGTAPAFSGARTIVISWPTLAAGDHVFRFEASWPTKGSNNGLVVKQLYGCPGPPPPASPPPPSPPTSKPSKSRQPVSKPGCPRRSEFRVAKPRRSITHGVVRFKVRGPGVVKTRWYIGGKRVRDEHSASLDITRRALKIALWRSDIWTRHNIWGEYRIKVKIRTHDRCKLVKSFDYFNQDPPPGVVISP